MGTTIRRQPLSFPIPASPDYRFLNITDFGGLDVSSNPFTVSSNTASDCLNVYVDEDNALSTRPRLQEKYDLMTLAGLDSSHEVVNIYNLHNGYLLHTIKNGSGYMYRFEEENGVLKSPTIITGTGIPLKKCELFEQNENIYLLTGDGYKNIIDDKISDVIGYIPTTTIGKFSKKSVKNSDGTETVEVNPAGESYESLNLLSNRYKETYFWDGTWNYNDTLNAFDVVENNYLHNEIPFAVDGFLIGGLTRINKNRLYTLNKNIIESRYLNGELIESENIDIFRDFEYTESDTDEFWTASYDGTVFVRWYRDKDVVEIYKRDSQESTFFVRTNVTVEGGNLYSCVINANGSRIVFGKVNPRELVVLCANESNEYTVATVTYNSLKSCFYTMDGVYIHPTKNIILVRGLTTGTTSNLRPDVFSIDVSEIQSNYEAVKLDVFLTHKAFPDIYNFTVGFSPTDNKLVLNVTFTYRDNGFVEKAMMLYYPDYSDFSTFSILREEEKSIIENPINDIVWSEDGQSLYFSEGYVNVSQNKPVFFDDLDFGLSGAKITGYYADSSNLHVTTEAGELLTSRFDWSSVEPKLIITKSKSDNDLTETYRDLKSLFEKAKLVERFDNNSWFASKNYTFHTEYNDPTYIPLSSYNDLGEDFEEITGLSIVNDNVLAAYKRNRIYIITPVTVGDQETYSYTETKNVVGNDVVNAPILTILTEMPTIVSYDGIYALNQLENVQSSDRITTLISESINPRWLKESVDDVNSCLTLNRLYWTHYILPHKKVGDDGDDYTKVYLLDNRTQQWYYWELPVCVTNAMVKDNKIHLISDGRVYTLETSDLIHEYNPDVTEYYDGVDGEKKIITWFWNSQILSLNTINYSKKLVDTTFILTDTDTQDEYGLDYSFKAWRKSVSETNATTISNNIHYVQSTTKRTMIPRFNFIQIKLSNSKEDIDNNKLRLVGLGLKYVLLEGLY